MTNAALLVRQPFRPLEVEESWDAALLREAASLIGYRPKAVLEAEEVRRRSLNENVLARALAEVDIQPFTIQSVEAYKARMLREAHRDESWALTRYMHRSGGRDTAKGERVVWYTGVPSWIVFGLLGAVGLVGHFSGFDAGWGWNEATYRSIQLTRYIPWSSVGHALVIPVLAVGAWSFLMYLRHKRAIEVQASWNSHQVSDSGPNYNDGYKRPIPAFAIQRMVSLKKALPEVTFSVQELQVSKKEVNTEKFVPPPLPDPFLVATYKGISCYVDVWDEPRFEGRRTV